jgi:hypothetical protein
VHAKSRPRLTKRLERRYRELLTGWTGLNSRWVDSRHPWAGEHLCWAAFHFADRWRSRDIDLARLANIVLRSNDAECCYRYAREIPGASVRKFQRQVIRYGTAELMRRFAREVPSADRAHLNGMADIAEIMEG